MNAEADVALGALQRIARAEPDPDLRGRRGSASCASPAAAAASEAPTERNRECVASGVDLHDHDSPHFTSAGGRCKRTALDWAAIAVEEHGRELAQSFVDAAKRGDWRASEALMNRIYGRPEETMRQVEVNPATAVLKSMSLDEKLELLRRLERGELADTGSASPVVEPVPPTA